MRLPRQLMVGLCVSAASFTCAFADDAFDDGQALRPVAVQQDELAYLPLVESLIDHVGEGEIDEAVAIIEKDTTKGVPEGGRDNLKRILAQVYGAGGDYEGHDVVAVKRITSRLHRVYALAYHERQPLVYVFTMYQFGGTWKIHHVHWNDKIDIVQEVVK